MTAENEHLNRFGLIFLYHKAYIPNIFPIFAKKI